MGHFLFNLANGDLDLAWARLRARRWPLERGERHCAALARGDLVLIHLGPPQCRFIGCAELASAFHDWAPPQAAAGAAGPDGGLTLTAVHEWLFPVALAAAVQRIDPTASNPYVQANAAGFGTGIVQITAAEYAAVLELSRAAR